MRTTMHIAFIVLVLSLSVGCVQKAKISVLQPGELKLTGVSKIALLDFNTLPTGVRSGVFAAGPETCRLARQTVADVFYKDPFYALVDLSLERQITRQISASRLKSRLDAVMYGRVWWQVGEEYLNYIPSSKELKSWRNIRYVCGHDDDGKPIYCKKKVTTRTRDVFYKRRYRAQKATLMMGLSVYRLDRNGHVEKISHVFEVANRPAFIENGKFSDRLELITARKENSKAKTLAAQEGDFMSGLSSFMGSLGLEGGKKAQAQLDACTTMDVCTLPVDLESQVEMCGEIGARLQKRIAPHREEIPVEVAGLDTKTKTLIAAEAYMANVKYITQTKLAKGYEDLAEEFYNVECLEAAKKLVARTHRARYDASIQGKKPEEIKPYEPLTQEELLEDTDEYLKDHVKDLFNLALSLEALGDFERALELYRFAFERYENEDQNYADGMGRCLLALDMADRLTEEDMVRLQAREKARL